jgi:L-gulonate 3-dehydrogenase
VVRTALEQLAEAGLGDEPVAAVLARVSVSNDLVNALGEVDYVQENAPEQLDVKQALFAQMDQLASPGAILASSSSSLTCTQVCEGLPGRARCIVAHPANPPHLLRAVELVPAAFTDPAVTARAGEVLRRAGQVPVVIGEIEGFVMNRLQAALAREALALVGQGIANAAGIDDIVKHSLGLRWAFMGPFETMDLNAPGGFAASYGVAFASLFGEDRWPEGAVGMVDAAMRAAVPLDVLEGRRGWRDRRLVALMRHQREQPD